ncbi:patatin-like phospholipase family protein [Vibrio mexicanus]|uniref:patatin-like phospholipase family protein n=1 Tax=Vibrio mexicanus TaxID=1004326 RepID=UPI00069BDDE9|nr:patatin-like phospholipase family protein [Vibrio mexicanus]
MARSNRKNILTSFLILFLSGCSATSTITNSPITSAPLSHDPPPTYSLKSKAQDYQQESTLVLLSFSGGGTRAAALSYGVLKGLRDYPFTDQDGEQSTLLDQVAVISSVSGGSFTSAYYGLYQEKIFEHYEDEFLYQTFSNDLVDILFSPRYWFSSLDRSTAAANYYNQALFDDATFQNIQNDGPIIIINATDLGGGVRFSFVQEYFDLICSNVNDYSIANAVAASSAVPFIFTPVVLENHDNCVTPHRMNSSGDTSAHVRATQNGLASYSDKKARPYIHLIDGGITDNLGLLAIYDIVQSDTEAFEALTNQVEHIIIISVDAATKPDWNIDSSPSTPKATSILGQRPTYNFTAITT